MNPISSFRSALGVLTVCCLASGTTVACGQSATDTSDGRVVERSDLVPSFPPAESTAGRDGTPGDPEGRDRTSGSVPDRTVVPRQATTRQQAERPAEGTTGAPAGRASTTTARLTDRTGDVAWSFWSLQRPPGYVDITRADLTRSSSGFELRVHFAAELPRRQPDDDRTMNVASFYDVTGDGEIDYEIWVNLADNGWGPGYLDRRNRKARFMADSGVEVRVEGNQLVHRFPLTLLGRASSLRWATASEWGSHEAISTPAAARDHAPDNGPAPFPG